MAWKRCSNDAVVFGCQSRKMPRSVLRGRLCSLPPGIETRQSPQRQRHASEILRLPSEHFERPEQVRMLAVAENPTFLIE